ncbi:hypothetical protein Sulku_1720 [Sulfuricurvum kujiense DSM 16994]|uniref:Uncharacterized protein n=1 Tax=Sulfuricurvum kujiense (strain ATCC BAA-921 / DSM 16994 / JCM 11577 / YK-1) TaxID=709032 RepID=E4U0X9_SULKY|nr:hypothetical protein [Sulfuricurvum kujiense]ADR34381.1 hypothetical protein Sulku_1720 [Sulfuricurvum kujiense DSM 16994]
MISIGSSNRKVDYKNIYEAIMGEVTKKSVYFDRVYTQPLGWARFIEENKCCNKYYLNLSNPELHNDGQIVFDFDLDQEDDPELEDAELLYCICNFEDSLKVFEVERNGGNGIRIQFVNAVAEFLTRGHGNIEIRRSFIIPLDTEMKNLLT